MITIVDYDTGNLRSVTDALSRLGAQYSISSDPKEIIFAQKVLFPGVGEASSAMAKLRERGLVDVLRSLTQPVLGICLGMQLMCRYSSEGDTECLGIIDNNVSRFVPDGHIKIPHIGWNGLYELKGPLYKGVKEGEYVYFVHSYFADVNQNSIALTKHGTPFSASIQKDNFYGCQFHPEKSGEVGERIISNFLSL